MAQLWFKVNGKICFFPFFSFFSIKSLTLQLSSNLTPLLSSQNKLMHFAGRVQLQAQTIKRRPSTFLPPTASLFSFLTLQGGSCHDWTLKFLPQDGILCGPFCRLFSLFIKTNTKTAHQTVFWASAHSTKPVQEDRRQHFSMETATLVVERQSCTLLHNETGSLLYIIHGVERLNEFLFAWPKY